MPSFTNPSFGNSVSGLIVGNGKLYGTSYLSGVISHFTLPISSNSTTTVIYGSSHFGWHHARRRHDRAGHATGQCPAASARRAK